MIDRNLVKEFRPRAEAALRELGKEMGITIKVGAISFTSNYFTAKLQATAEGSESKEAAAYRLYGKMAKLPDLGATVRLNGVAYKIAGYNPKAYKMPVLITRVSDGKSFRCSQNQIKTAGVIVQK